MENQEVYKIENGVKNVTIAHKKGLDSRAPHEIAILGNIDSPRKWIEKRHIEYDDLILTDMSGQVIDYKSHILIDRNNMGITLCFNETDPFYRGKVKGKLNLHPDFSKWKINTGESWDHKELSEFIKMNRSCFDNKSDAMKLSSELSNIKIKADNKYEKADDNRGSVKTMIAQNIIESNIPKTFKLNVPIFKGTAKTTFEVEVYVNPGNYSVTFVSPDANDIVSGIKNKIIDDEVKAIEKIAPELVIIEV
jgi:hypothetical protein